MFTVTQSILSPGDSTFYSNGLRNHLESYMGIIRTLSSNRVNIPPDLVHQFQGNLYGLLASIGAEAWAYWAIMRVNNYYSPTEFGFETIEKAKPVEGIDLLLPDYELIALIKRFYLNKKKD